MTEENTREDANKYELMVIINPEIGMEAVNKRLEEIRKVIAAKKGGVAGEIFFEEIWGMRDLAYKIKKHDKGYYAVFDFVTDSSLIREMENTLSLEPEVIRHMIVKLPGNYATKNYLALFAEQAALEEERRAQRLAKKRPAPKTVTRVAKPVAAKPAEKAEEPAVKEAGAKEAAVKKTETKEPAVKETEAKEPTVAEKPKKKETTLEDVDAKLKSIIENPDINF